MSIAARRRSSSAKACFLFRYPHEVDVARPTAAAQSSGGPYTLPALVTRLKWRPLSEAQQVYFAVRPQAGATAKVGCANHEPGARVCSSSHRVYSLLIPMYWVYLNGYKKRVGLGWGAPRGVAPLLWLSIGSPIIGLGGGVAPLAKTIGKAYVRGVLSAYIHNWQKLMYVLSYQLDIYKKVTETTTGSCPGGGEDSRKKVRGYFTYMTTDKNTEQHKQICFLLPFSSANTRATESNLFSRLLRSTEEAEGIFCRAMAHPLPHGASESVGLFDCGLMSYS